MFDFLFADPHEDRKVDTTVINNVGECTVDTCYVNDGLQDYETAVQHPKYNRGNWVIVEAYDTKEEAQEGHDKWVKIMSSTQLPKKLVDCKNSFVSNLLDNNYEFEFEG